jgi:hypothetical protein
LGFLISYRSQLCVSRRASTANEKVSRQTDRGNKSRLSYATPLVSQQVSKLSEKIVSRGKTKLEYQGN